MIIPHIVDQYATRIAQPIGVFDWAEIDFEVGETPNNVYGYFQASAVFTKSGKGKQFKQYVKTVRPKIVINSGIIEKFPAIIHEVIMPHEMGHAVQYFHDRQGAHDQFFDWVMRKMDVQQGATFDPENYGLSEADRNRLNLLTGKQEKVLIEHESGERFVITANMWTRMITAPRRSKSGLILNRGNCKVVQSSSNL